MPPCYRLHGRFEGLNVVRRLQRVVKLKIDLMLPEPNLVMPDLHL